MSVLDVICLGAALLVCLYPLLILGASLRGLSERLMQSAMAGRSFWRRRRLERVYPALRPGAPALVAGVTDGISWEIRAVPLGAGETPAGLSVRAGPVETPVQRFTARQQSALSRVDALAILIGDTPARLEAFVRAGGRIEGGLIRRDMSAPLTEAAAEAAAREALPEVLEIARRIQLRPEEVPERLIAALGEGDGYGEDRRDRLRALIRGWPDRLRSEGWARLTAVLEDEAEDVRLEMALFLPDRDTLRDLFYRVGRVDVMQKALAGMDDDMLGGLAAEVFGEALALPEEAFWRERVRPVRVWQLSEQIAARRSVAALPLLAPMLGRCQQQQGAQSDLLNQLCESLLSAFAAVAPPGEASEDVALPFLDSREPQIELVAIKVIGRIGTVRSVPLLRTRLGVLIQDARGRMAAEAIAAIRQRSGGSGGGLMLAEGGAVSVAEGGAVSVAGGLPLTEGADDRR